MAKRPVFISLPNNKFVKEVYTEFKWYPGMAKVQKQKSIESLHEEFIKLYPNLKVLDISSKSTKELGNKLSAFNLMMKSNIENKQFSVESAFHASKVFEKGGPYADIIGMDSKNAKRDERLKESGKLISFKYADKEWDIEPKTMFYDWLYISALSLESNRELANQVLMYDAFTDIEFNPAKSINCQAKAVALYVSLSRQGILDTVLKATDEYINIITLNKTII